MGGGGERWMCTICLRMGSPALYEPFSLSIYGRVSCSNVYRRAGSEEAWHFFVDVPLGLASEIRNPLVAFSACQM